MNAKNRCINLVWQDILKTSVDFQVTYPVLGYCSTSARTSIKIKSPVLSPRDELDREFPLVVDTAVGAHRSPGREGGPAYGPPTGQADAVNQEQQSTTNVVNSVDLAVCAGRRSHCEPRAHPNRAHLGQLIHWEKVQKPIDNPNIRTSGECLVNPLAVRTDFIETVVARATPRSVDCATGVQQFAVSNRVIVSPEYVAQRTVTNNTSSNTSSSSSNKSHRKIIEILEGSNQTIRNINEKLLVIARAMTPTWSLRLLGVSCGSVVCAWGLLLILSVIGGASHGTGISGYDFDNAGTMEDLNSPRCPWACSCEGQELDCSERGLTQVPGDLAVLAEKLYV